MEVKELLDKFVENNNLILEKVYDTIGQFKDSADVDIILPKLVSAIEESKFNPALGVYFASILQLTSNEKIVETTSFEDIQDLFASLLRIQEYNLEVYSEAAHFEWSTMDNEEAAKQYIKNGIERAEDKIKELTELLIEIDAK